MTDAEGMKARGISPSEVAQIVSATFNDMIFIHGHVHCDPHAANLLVHKGKNGKVSLLSLSLSLSWDHVRGSVHRRRLGICQFSCAW